MRNYVAPGQSVDLVAGVGESYAVGQGYVVGSIFGVAANNADEGETATLHLTGIYEFPAAEGSEAEVGDVAYWSDTDKAVSVDSAEGLYAIGSVVGVDGDTVQVRLDGTAVSAVPAAGGGSE